MIQSAAHLARFFLPACRSLISLCDLSIALNSGSAKRVTDRFVALRYSGRGKQRGLATESMDINSANVDSAANVTRTLVGPKATRKRSLAGIRPWTWFVIDYAMAYASSTLAFALTPYALIAVKGDHVGQLGFSFGAALMVAVVAHIAGLHELNQKKRSFGLLARCFFVSLIAVVLINAELLFVHYLTVGRLITVFTLLGCTVGLFALRALIVGLAERNTFVAALVGSNDFIEHSMGFLGDKKAGGVKIISLDLSENPGIDLRQWATLNGVDQVVVDVDDPLAPSQSDLLKLLDGTLTVSRFTSFVENLYEKVPTQHISAQWIIDSQSEHESLYKSTMKRVFDCVIASIALILSLPFVLIAAIAIKLESPGPIIFRQERVGQYGETFTMLKLRSMRSDAEKDGAQYAQEGDARVTRIGKFLRSSRIDEAPQLINVLLGHMSLVGPRPERPEFTSKLESNIQFFVHRLMVKPGITGWAQINADYAVSEEDSVNKLSYDLYYVKMLSFAMDLRILLRTISRFSAGAR